MSSDDRRVILEHFDHKFAILLENIGEMIDRRVRPIVQEELVEVKEEMTLMKFAIKETNRDVQNLDKRIYGVENQMNKVEKRMEKVEDRMGKVEEKVDAVEDRMGHVEQAIERKL